MCSCTLTLWFLLLELSLEEKKHEYDCQIRSLENEIRLLEDELKRRDLPLEDIKDEQLEQAMLVGCACTCSYMHVMVSLLTA